LSINSGNKVIISSVENSPGTVHDPLKTKISMEKGKYHAAYSPEEEQRSNTNPDNFGTFQNQVNDRNSDRKSVNRTLEDDVRFEGGNYTIRPSGLCGFCKSREQIQHERDNGHNKDNSNCNTF